MVGLGGVPRAALVDDILLRRPLLPNVGVLEVHVALPGKALRLRGNEAVEHRVVLDTLEDGVHLGERELQT